MSKHGLLTLEIRSNSIVEYTSVPLIFNLIISALVAMIIHELGHVVAARMCGVRTLEFGLGYGPKLCGLRIGRMQFHLRALPLGTYVRLDGTLLQKPFPQQFFIHLSGAIVNFAAALVAHETIFGWINLLVGLANLLPIYYHDGWKCGVVLLRAVLKRRSVFAEKSFTYVGGVVSLVLIIVGFYHVL